MWKVRLYVDDSEESRIIEQELQKRGIEYLRIPESPIWKTLPILETETQLLAGAGDIFLYYLNEGNEGEEESEP